MLGSDDEKEAFFKDFEMREELLEFYRSKEKYIELYHLLLEDRQLSSALEVAVSYNLQCEVPHHELEAVFHFVHVESISSALMSETGLTSLAHQFEKISCPSSLTAAACQWRNTVHFLASIKRDKVFTELGSIKNSVIRDFLGLFVSSLYIEQVRLAKLMLHRL